MSGLCSQLDISRGFDKLSMAACMVAAASYALNHEPRLSQNRLHVKVTARQMGAGHALLALLDPNIFELGHDEWRDLVALHVGFQQ